MRRVKKACVSSSAIPSWWSTQPSRVTLMLKVKSPMVSSVQDPRRDASVWPQPVPNPARGRCRRHWHQRGPRSRPQEPHRLGPLAVLGERYEAHGGELVVEVLAGALLHRVAVTRSVEPRLATPDHAEHLLLAPPHAERGECPQRSKRDGGASHPRVVAHLGFD